MLLQPGSKPMKYKRIVSDLTNTVTVYPQQQWKASVSWTALNIEVPWVLLSVYKYVAQYDQWISAWWRLPNMAWTSIIIDDTPLTIPTAVNYTVAYWYGNPAYNYSDIPFWDFNNTYNRASSWWYLSYMKKQTIVSPNPVTYSWDNFPAYFYDTSSSNLSPSYRLNIPFNKIVINHYADSVTVWAPSSATTLSVKSYLVIEYAVSE